VGRGPKKHLGTKIKGGRLSKGGGEPRGQAGHRNHRQGRGPNPVNPKAQGRKGNTQEGRGGELLGSERGYAGEMEEKVHDVI